MQQEKHRLLIATTTQCVLTDLLASHCDRELVLSRILSVRFACRSCGDCVNLLPAYEPFHWNENAIQSQFVSWKEIARAAWCNTVCCLCLSISSPVPNYSVLLMVAVQISCLQLVDAVQALSSSYCAVPCFVCSLLLWGSVMICFRLCYLIDSAG